MNIDLNRLIPAFLSADDERRRRAMAALTEPDPGRENETASPEPDRLLNQAEIAKMLGVHPTTVRRWLLPCHRLGRLPRYSRHEVAVYLSSDAFQMRLTALKQQRVK